MTSQIEASASAHHNALPVGRWAALNDLLSVPTFLPVAAAIYPGSFAAKAAPDGPCTRATPPP